MSMLASRSAQKRTQTSPQTTSANFLRQRRELLTPCARVDSPRRPRRPSVATPSLVSLLPRARLLQPHRLAMPVECQPHRSTLPLQFAIVAGQRLVSEHTQLSPRHVTEVRDQWLVIAVALIVQNDVRPGAWASELEEVLLRVGHRFGRVDLRRRMSPVQRPKPCGRSSTRSCRTLMSAVVGSIWPARPQRSATAASLWWRWPPLPAPPPSHAASPSLPGSLHQPAGSGFRSRLAAALDHAVAACLGIVLDRPGPSGQRHGRRTPAARPGLQPARHREDPRGRRPSGPRRPVRPPEPHRRRLPQQQPAGDITPNSGWVNVGTDHDTAEFAVESIRRWWQHRGQAGHPDATRLLINADSEGSNDPRRWTWKKHLHAFAHESGLQITVCHFPPGASKVDTRPIGRTGRSTASSPRRSD